MVLRKVHVVAPGRSLKLGGAPVGAGDGLLRPGSVVRAGEKGLTKEHIADLLKDGAIVETVVDDDGPPAPVKKDPAADRGGVLVPNDPEKVGRPLPPTAPRLAWDQDPEALRQAVAAGDLGANTAAVLDQLNRMIRERDQAHPPMSDVDAAIALLSRDFVRR